ncbi:DNA repair protein RecO [Candidatus Protochlamydia naegleriophila]|uniref:DNA repair protein RecO n=2 Tax=Candidatus Protochlamydia naegleriophila TaxID=389348 RepID=A0A0U5JDR5_9BACT|nr:DNA repair protein RecO [Candidatus Protochlamydia naegleriophila]
MHRKWVQAIALAPINPVKWVCMSVSSDFHTAEGIVVKVIPFRDYDQILVVFTREAGVIKVLHKGSRSKKRGVQGLCMPLTRIEVVYKEKKGEIFSCHELAHLGSYHALRHELSHLNAACDLLQVIYQTQLIGKPAPQLFALLKLYLEKIPSISSPCLLTTSFRLKLLKHEGVSAYPLACSHCLYPLLKEAFVYQGEAYCRDHRVAGSYALQEMELGVLYKLMVCQSYQELAQTELLPQTKTKLERYFRERMQK